MSAGDPVLILGYKPGPASGMTIAIVDAPGFVQAEFVVAERIKGTPEEQRVLRQMLDNRANIAEAVQEVGF